MIIVIMMMIIIIIIIIYNNKKARGSGLKSQGVMSLPCRAG